MTRPFASNCQDSSDRALTAPKSNQPLQANHPTEASACHSLAIKAFERGEHLRGLELTRLSIQLAPQVPDFYNDLATMLGRLGRHSEAAKVLIDLLRLRPDLPEAHNNLGVAAEHLGDFDAAVAAYRQAITRRPLYAEAHHHLGNVLRKKGHLLESIAAQRRAIQIRPAFAAPLRGIANAYTEMGRAFDAADAWKRVSHSIPDSPQASSDLIHSLLYCPDVEPTGVMELARQWERRHGVQLDPESRHHPNVMHPGRQLRIGYVSADFCDHPVARFLLPLLTEHRRHSLSVFCYGDVATADAVTRQVQKSCEVWRETIAHSHRALEEIIRADQIDILVDLAGHTAGNRLPVFARKPAPVQASWLGYPATTGLTAVDYRISDPVSDPPGMTDRLHAERLHRLPGCSVCYVPDSHCPIVSPLPSAFKPHITFGCLNKVVKISRPCATVWARILADVPEARLLLSSVGGDPDGSVRSGLCSAGIPSDRLDILPKAGTRQEYFERFADIDIALDPFPYNGTTTTCDGLWMGVPHVTLAGTTAVSRAGASILTAVGMSEFVTRSEDEYFQVAMRLAEDHQRLSTLRATMRARMTASSLLDVTGFVGELAGAYRQMWASWCASAPAPVA